MKHLIVLSLVFILTSIKTIFGVATENSVPVYLFCQYYRTVIDQTSGLPYRNHSKKFPSHDDGEIYYDCEHAIASNGCKNGYLSHTSGWSDYGCDIVGYYIASCPEKLNEQYSIEVEEVGKELSEGCGHKSSTYDNVLCIKERGDDGCSEIDQYYLYNSINNKWELANECPNNCDKCDADGKCITTTSSTTSTKEPTTSTTSIDKPTTSTTSTDKPITSTISTSEPTTSIKCGKGYEKCPIGQCCSKNGICGTTNAFCSNSKGCQPEYGECRCGKKFGSCPSGFCCSKYGWCGSDPNYCSAENGCQSKYGECRCGKNGFGSCPGKLCCSKYGWCGSDSNYCSIRKGCQLRYGKCK